MWQGHHAFKALALKYKACLGVLGKNLIGSLRTETVCILFKAVSAFYHFTFGEMNGISKLHSALT